MNNYTLIQDNDKEITRLKNRFYRYVDIHINDSHFYKVALNLSENREELEQKATNLIDQVGYINALKISAK